MCSMLILSNHSRMLQAYRLQYTQYVALTLSRCQAEVGWQGLASTFTSVDQRMHDI